MIPEIAPTRRRATVFNRRDMLFFAGGILTTAVTSLFVAEKANQIPQTPTAQITPMGTGLMEPDGFHAELPKNAGMDLTTAVSTISQYKEVTVKDPETGMVKTMLVTKNPVGDSQQGKK